MRGFEKGPLQFTSLGIPVLLLLMATLVSGQIKGNLPGETSVLDSILLGSSVYGKIPLEFQNNYDCSELGTFPMTGSCTHYYICGEMKNYGKLTVFRRCPEGSIFDVAHHMCVRSSQITTRSECTNVHNQKTIPVTEEPHQEPPEASTSPSNIILESKAVLTCEIVRSYAPLFTSDSLNLASIKDTALGILDIEASDVEGITGVEFLNSIVNHLRGMYAKLNATDRSFMENQIENKIFYHIILNLMSLNQEGHIYDFQAIKKLAQNGLFDNDMNIAIKQGFLPSIEESSEVNRPNIKLSIGEILKIINEEVKKAKCDIKEGYASVSSLVDNSIINPIVTNLLNLTITLEEEVSELQNILRTNQSPEENIKSYLMHLENNNLEFMLYEMLNSNPHFLDNILDETTLSLLDLSLYQLEMHAFILSSATSSKILLAKISLRQKYLDKFNDFMDGVAHNLNKIKSIFDINNPKGITKLIQNRLDSLQRHPSLLNSEHFENNISEKQDKLNQLMHTISQYLENNLEIPVPGQILEAPDFSSSQIQVPLFQWKKGSVVSYSLQYISDKSISKVGPWSAAATVENKANPTVYLPPAENMIKLVYRKFNQENAELVGIMYNNELSFWDISRDFIKAGSLPNRNNANRQTRKLLRGGADPNVALENHMTPLHQAALKGDERLMNNILLNKDTDKEVATFDEQRPIHFAVRSGDENSVLALLDRGVSVNVKTKYLGWPPLHIAVANDYVNIINHLIENGAHINQGDNNNLTALHVAAAFEKEQSLKTLLTNEGIDINSEDAHKLTPLYYAIQNSNLLATQILLKNDGIEINHLDKHALAPIHFAAMNGNLDIIKELINHGALLSGEDREGLSPLHYCAFYGNIDACLILLKNKESLKNIKNYEGKTAIDLARANKHEDIVMLLSTEHKYQETTKKEEANNTKEISTKTTSSGILPMPKFNCSDSESENLILHVKNMCTNVGFITKFTESIAGFIPYNTQSLEHKYGQFINYYNEYLNNTKINSFSWRNQNNVLGKIRYLLGLVKHFETKYNEKYDIYQKILTRKINNQENDVEFEKRIEGEIFDLEDELQEAKDTLAVASISPIRSYLENLVKRLEKQIQEKDELLVGNATTELQIKELLDFLDFIKQDAELIYNEGSALKSIMDPFLKHIEDGKNVFFDIKQKSKNNLKNIQRVITQNNKNLNDLRLQEEKLENEIEVKQNEINEMYDEVQTTTDKLRAKRLELVKRMGENSTKRLMLQIGVMFLRLPQLMNLLGTANQQEKAIMTEWQDNLALNQALLQELENKQKEKWNEVYTLRSIIANSTSNAGSSSSYRNEILTFNLLSKDLQNLNQDIVKIDSSTFAQGLDTILNFFKVIIEKFNDLINQGKNTESSDKTTVLNEILNELSKIKCNWQDLSIFIVDTHQCSNIQT